MFKKALPIYWCLCFVLTHLPPSGMPSAIEGVDKLAHCLGYFVLSFLFTAAKNPKRWSVLKIGGILFLYSVFDEVTQPLVGRDFELLDIAADLLGSTLGLWLSVKIFPEK